VEFTGVELTDGAKLAAPVEKAAAGREAQWRGRKTGCRAWTRWRCQSAEQRRDGEGGAVESTVAEATRRSAITALW